MSRQERGAMRAKLAARRASQIVAEATERAVAARPIPRTITEADEARLPKGVHPGRVAQAARKATPTPTSPQDQAAEAKRLRDGGMAWWQIGQQLKLAGAASSASEPEAKRGAGAARRLYAAANRGEVPRTQRPRAGSTPKPTGPASRAVPAYLRKEQLVNEGHVIPRDMPDEEVEALLVGRRIEWAIDLARLTETDPTSWGGESGRWVKQEARVHVDGKWVRVVDRSDEGKDRVVYFREYGGRDKDGNHMSGPTRCVRVDAIFTVA